MRRRQAFTIVEMLVALALILFIMVILSEAFSSALETFRTLKAIGDMQERLRSAAMLVRQDLQADHFDDPFPRLRDQDLRKMPPPMKGYFRIVQGYHLTSPYPPNATNTNPPSYQGSFWEGSDQDSVYSTRANDNWMAFTIRLRGNRPENWLYGQLPTVPPGDASTNQYLNSLGPPDYRYNNTNVMLSQWAEVAYFLIPLYVQGTNNQLKLTIDGTPTGTPLYALYRRQRLLAPPFNGHSIPSSAQSFYTDVSYQSSNGNLNDPQSITVPDTRLGGFDGSTLQPLGTGDDLVLNDVISFDLKVIYQDKNSLTSSWTFPSAFTDLPAATSGNNSTYTALQKSVFDTWSSQTLPGQPSYAAWSTPGTPTSMPLQVRILAIQVTFRIWDARTQQARQLSVIQDL